MFLQTFVTHKSFPPICGVNSNPGCHLLSLISPKIMTPYSFHNYPHSNVILSFWVCQKRILRPQSRSAILLRSELTGEPKPSSSSDSNPKTRSRDLKSKVPLNKDETVDRTFPTTIPRKPKRGRKREAAAVEDFVRDSLERTFASIRQQNSEVFINKEDVLKDRVGDSTNVESSDSDDDDDDDSVNGRGEETVVEEDSPNWPLDAEVGWGIRASEYFEQHPIKNVVGEDGVEIDWEGEIDDGWVKEINCLEWESFAFHPSPLVVLVFERYNRASYNWKVLKELEKAAKVYWSAKDRLPPRTVKIDINIERDLAYALKVKEGPQILFLRGNKIIYREKEVRTADELVHMIAHFYYNAKKPSWVDDAALSPPY